MRSESRKLIRGLLIASGLIAAIGLSSVSLVAQDSIHGIIAGIAGRQGERELSEDLINGLYLSAGGHEHLISSQRLTLSPERESASVSQDFVTEVREAADGYSDAASVFAKLIEEGYELSIGEEDASTLEGLGYPTDPNELLRRMQDEASTISSALTDAADSASDEAFGRAIFLANHLSTVVAVVGQVQGVLFSK